MALAEPSVRRALVGRPKPRIAPPTPARSQVDAFVAQAIEIGIELMPWQKTAARYLVATGRDDLWLYPEVALIVARQNGKTKLLVPLIVSRLLAGLRIMHTAQNRELPREVFGAVADIMEAKYGHLLRSKPRFANGQEEIRMTNGGIYRIVAPTRGGARGPSNDLVVIDELREMVDHDFIGAAKPTLTASPNPQIVYLSNAGTDDSEVLNALKRRAESDPSLAYLEWSASPERAANDHMGWIEANPAIGHMPQTVRYLEREYQSSLLGGTMSLFEVEHLCRWAVTIRERLVQEFSWLAGQADELPEPRNAVMGISMDPSGKRASAALAWQMGEQIGLKMLFDVPGDPIDTDLLGRDMQKMAGRMKVRRVAYDPLTDGELAKFFVKPEPISGGKYANASARFATAVKAGVIQWTDADAVTADLIWTAKKPHDESGSYQAVRANDDRPITAVLAAIRAVWLASGPKPPAPKVM